MAVISDGTTIIDAGGLGASIASGAMNLISTTTASNLFLANYSDALLYSTLAEAEPYLVP